MLEPASCLRRGTMSCRAALAFAAALALLPRSGLGAPNLPTMVAPTIVPSATSGPLRIEVEPSIGDADLIPGWILERNPSVAEQVPLVEGHAQWIAVTISGVTYDYRVSVIALRDGMPLRAAQKSEECQCTSEMLLERIDSRITEELAVLRRAPLPRAASKSPRPERITGQDSGASSTDRLPRRLSPMGWAGIGVGVLGAGLLAAGVPVVLRPGDTRGEIGRLETRSTHSSGFGLAAGGGSALAVGISLLVVDLVRQRQRAVSAIPVLDDRQLGIVVTWRVPGKGR